MIDRGDLLKQECLYSYDNKVWRILGYYEMPSVDLECVTTGERMNFSLGGLLDESFKKIEGVKIR